MRTLKFEELLPHELLEVQRREQPIYLPVGSMEWHGPHMGMGVDACNAYAVALGAAAVTGGAVYPPLYIGTETYRSAQSLARLGLPENARVKGMDFPANSLPSFYWPPELFEQIIAAQLDLLCQMGFLHLAAINGHAAAVQKEILARQCARCETQYGARAAAVTALFEGCGAGLGHAGLAETAIMQYLRPDAVELTRLPAAPQPLFYADWGIADAGGSGSGDFTVRFDPRAATPELGETITRYAAQQCVLALRKAGVAEEFAQNV